MTLEAFLLEYGSTLFGCFAVGWAFGLFEVYFIKLLDRIF